MMIEMPYKGLLIDIAWACFVVFGRGNKHRLSAFDFR